MSDTILSQLLYINGIWKCTDGKAFSNQYSAYIHQLGLNGQGGLKSKVSQPSMIKKLEGEINRLKKQIEDLNTQLKDLEKSLPGYDFNSCAEPFRMGNMIVFEKPEKLDFEVSVNGGEWMPSNRLFIIGNEGCTIRTKTINRIGYGNIYEPEIIYGNTHQDYWEEAEVEPPQDRVYEYISPEKTFIIDNRYPYYYWAYKMFNSYRDWQIYENWYDNPSQRAFSDLSDFMNYLNEEWYWFRENIFDWTNYKWFMPIVFASWQDMPDGMDYRRMIESLQSVTDRNNNDFITSSVYDSSDVKIYMPRILSYNFNSNVEIQILKDKLKQGIDSGSNNVFGLPIALPLNWYKRDNTYLEQNEELFVFSDYFKAIIEFIETIPSGQRFHILYKIIQSNSFNVENETPGAYYKNDIIASILKGLDFENNNFWSGLLGNIEECEEVIDTYFVCWLFQYILYGITCMNTGDFGNMWACFDRIITMFYIDGHNSMQSFLADTCDYYNIDIYNSSYGLDLYFYAFTHLLKSCVNEYLNPQIPNINY